MTMTMMTTAAVAIVTKYSSFTSFSFSSSSLLLSSMTCTSFYDGLCGDSDADDGMCGDVGGDEDDDDDHERGL